MDQPDRVANPAMIVDGSAGTGKTNIILTL